MHAYLLEYIQIKDIHLGVHTCVHSECRPSYRPKGVSLYIYVHTYVYNYVCASMCMCAMHLSYSFILSPRRHRYISPQSRLHAFYVYLQFSFVSRTLKVFGYPYILNIFIKLSVLYITYIRILYTCSC